MRERSAGSGLSHRAKSAWERLSPATKKQRDNLMQLALERAGNQPIERWDRKFIIASCDARAATPAQARNFLGVLRALFQWGLSREHVETDPTVGVKVERLRGDGFHAWTAEEMARFEARWPIGTRERLAYDIMLWTGLRRGDAARVGPQHVKNGVITLKTAKTGAPVTDCDSASACALDRRNSHRINSFITRGDGKPMVKEVGRRRPAPVAGIANRSRAPGSGRKRILRSGSESGKAFPPRPRCRPFRGRSEWRLDGPNL